MPQDPESLPNAARGWALFVVVGLLTGAAAAPVLHLLNDRYRFEPTGQMAGTPELLAQEVAARSRGDWLSSALQGGLLGAIFGLGFGAAEGLRRRSARRLLTGALVGGVVGAAAAVPARNAIRDFCLYCVSNNLRGLHVSAAIQGLLWVGPALGAAAGLWAAAGFARGGAKLGLAALVAGAVACFAVPVVGQIVFPVDYSDQIAEHPGQSALTSLLVGGIVGIGVAFAARPAPRESSA